ncbi:MAG: hypothetical protein AB7I50_06290 [Vicinamibacterales bacterium]
MSNGTPKTALELALERLRKSDEAAGIVEKPLTEAQRTAIAEARNVYEARFAEAKILHESKLAVTADPEARARLDEDHRRDVDRLAVDRDRKIEDIRRSHA